MSWTRRHLIAGTIAAVGRRAASQTNAPEPENGIAIHPGPFSTKAESCRLTECPDWFRDAKFGIWAHRGPSSAIGDGDWYARNMYIEGNPQYEYHLKTYGYPSKFGYKDTIPLWKAERFDAKALIRLYKEAGAKYFVSMGVHCDNFDLWNSKNHRWNSVRMGPKRDIVTEWRNAARDARLRFGVSQHVWGSYNWWETNKGSDKRGPYAGVPLRRGRVRQLRPVLPSSSPPRRPGRSRVTSPNGGNASGSFVLRISSTSTIPISTTKMAQSRLVSRGRSLAAHYYNSGLRWHNGELEVVYTGKSRREAELGACTLDVERGVTDDIEPRPFQTDTCIGAWHYKRGITYKTPKRVIDMLVDVVSRNGNLLLNIPLPASGMPDDEELHILSEVTTWTKTNAEAIYGTRPWKTFGEGPGAQKASSGAGMNGTAEHFNEKSRKDPTGADVRFTSKDAVLYAFVMGHNADRDPIGR